MKSITHPWELDPYQAPVNVHTAASLVEAWKKDGRSEQEITASVRKLTEEAPRYHFRLLRHSVGPGETAVGFLSVRNSRGEKMAFEIREAAVLHDDRPLVSLGTAEFQDNGEGHDRANRDHEYVVTWKAPSSDKKYWGILRFRIRAAIPGSADILEWTFPFLSTPFAPARFTGSFQERIENGSLVIDVGLDILEKRRCSILGNLYSVETGEPTHVAIAQGTIRPGQKYVSLLFHGKIFRDEGASGKFLLRDLRGKCENLPFDPDWIGDPTRTEAMNQIPGRDGEPTSMVLPYTELTYTTRDYAASVFSDQEWESPEKDARSRVLEESAKAKGFHEDRSP